MEMYPCMKSLLQVYDLLKMLALVYPKLNALKIWKKIIKNTIQYNIVHRLLYQLSLPDFPDYQ